MYSLLSHDGVQTRERLNRDMDTSYYYYFYNDTYALLYTIDKWIKQDFLKYAHIKILNSVNRPNVINITKYFFQSFLLFLIFFNFPFFIPIIQINLMTLHLLSIFQLLLWSIFNRSFLQLLTNFFITLIASSFTNFLTNLFSDLVFPNTFIINIIACLLYTSVGLQFCNDTINVTF